MEHSHQVPLLDLAAYTAGGDAAARHQTSEEFAAKVRLNGFIGLTSHGISPRKLEQTFDTSKKFFDLDYDEKMVAAHPDGPLPHRGYSGIGREQVAATLSAGDEAVKDYKESFEIGSDSNVIQRNIWPRAETSPDFRKVTTEFFWQVNQLSQILLEIFALSLNLTDWETKQLLDLHIGDDNQLRLLHYPSVDHDLLETTHASRLGAHRDWSSFTLLFQDASGGLEVYDRQSENFISAVPIPGVVYMNIGDMLHRYSNGIYPSALHRVVPPDHKSDSIPPRYSIPFFVVPSPNQTVAPPPSLVSTAISTNREVFQPVTFNSYSSKLFAAMTVT